MALCVLAKADEANWPAFRGVRAGGIAQGYETPSTWDVEKGDNVKWKTPIGGLAHSSPVIWGNRIFVTTAVKKDGKANLKVGLYGDVASVEGEMTHQFLVLCLDKRTGNILWKRLAHEGVPKIKRHLKSSHANPTPATNGRCVMAFFGSEGLYCYDMEGVLLWKKDLGVLDSGYFRMPRAQWGFASSPIIHQNMVIVQCDIQKGSFLAAFDIQNKGAEIWRTARDDVCTWGTPTIDVRNGRSQVIVNGYKHTGGYDLTTGKELWRLKGGGDIPVPTPIVAHDLIFITNAHGRLSPTYAIRANAQGDVSLEGKQLSNHGVAWSYKRGGNYMQTPIVVGDHLFACTDRGLLTCYKAKTGEILFAESLPIRGGSSASPVCADGKIYITSEVGDVLVLKAEPEYALIATNSLGETCMATPAISEGVLFFRTRSHIIAVGN